LRAGDLLNMALEIKRVGLGDDDPTMRRADEMNCLLACIVYYWRINRVSQVLIQRSIRDMQMAVCSRTFGGV